VLGVILDKDLRALRYLDIMRYDTLTWTRKLSIQLYLAHEVRKKETKTNKRQCPFNTVQVSCHLWCWSLSHFPWFWVLLSAKLNNRITIPSCYNKVYTAVQGVLQNVAYLEKQQHAVLDDTSTASYIRSKHIYAYIRL